MAQDKEEQGHGSSRRPAEADDKKTAATKTAGAGRSAPRAAGTGATGQGAYPQRRQQYLIALRPPGAMIAGSQLFQPQSIDAIVDYPRRQEDIEIVARVKPAGAQPFSPDGTFAQEIVVARLTEGRAESLQAAAHPQIIVERDGPLSSADGAFVMRPRLGVNATL